MIAGFKAGLLWVYNWITVIVASLVGVPDLVLQALSYVDGVDLSPLVGADRALRIITGVALAKAVLSIIGNAMREED